MGKNLILPVVAVLILLAVVVACGTKARQTSLPGELQPGITSIERTPVNIEDALADLEELPAPEGVDPAVFEELRQSLAEALTERREEKRASGEPSDEGRRVQDLTLHVEPGGDSATLEWHYRNDGDYNQNGIVDIADIVPLARHFGEDATGPNTLAGVADGNHNGKVGMSDVTPIAVNYGAEVVAYSVNYSAYEWYAYWESSFDYGYIDVVELSDGLGKENGRVRFSFGLSYNASYWYRVLPLNSHLEIGPVSELAVSEDSYTVSGYVLDHNEQGLSDITLTLDGEEWTSTDTSGKFSFPDVPCGEHTISPQAAGTLFFPESRAVSVEGANVFSCIFGAEKALHGTWRFTNISNLGSIGSVAFINGKLAVPLYKFTIDSYSSATIAYLRSADSSGFSWEVPIDVGQATSYAPLLAEVSGNPALAFYNTTTDYIVYVRADDSDGTSWGESLGIAYLANYADFSFSIVDGRPAIVYRKEDDDLYYHISDDVNGDEWFSPPHRIARITGASDVSCSLAEVNGRPAVAYSVEDESVFFAIADDESGLSWSDPIELGELHSGYYGGVASLAVIDHKPAVVYLDHNVGHVLYVEALGSTGTEWGEPYLLNRWAYGYAPHLCEVDGEPAVAYTGMYCTRKAGVWRYTRIPSLSGSYLADIAADDGIPIIAYRSSNYTVPSNWIIRLE